MSTYEIIVIIFLSMTFVLALMNMMIRIADKFSERRK